MIYPCLDRAAGLAYLLRQIDKRTDHGSGTRDGADRTDRIPIHFIIQVSSTSGNRSNPAPDSVLILFGSLPTPTTLFQLNEFI